MLHPLFFSCPAYSFFFCFDASYKLSSEYYWLSLGVTHALVWVLVGLASWLAPRAWQDQPSGKKANRWPERWRVWVYGRPEQRKALRTRLLAANPFCWLASRARLKPAAVWLFLSLVAAWWLFLRFVEHMDWMDDSFNLTTALLLNCGLKIWIAIEAGQRLAEEQKMGTLELLLSTPLNDREILRGQFLALKRQFLKPLAVVVASEILLMVAVWHYAAPSAVQQVHTGLAGLFLLALDVAALSGVALFSALTAKNPNLASVNTILRILLLPWVLFAAIASVASLWSAGGMQPTWRFYLGLWFWLGVSADLIFGLPAWWQLRTRFRDLALRRLTTPRKKQAG